MKNARSAGFLNVDLVIESSASLQPLVDEMDSSVFVLHHGPMKGGRFLVFEADRETNTPDDTIRVLCRAVERLSAHGRKVWDRARRKEFNVGYDLRAGAPRVEVALLPVTVKCIAALGATVAFTCYRDDEARPGGTAKPSKDSADEPPPSVPCGSPSA